MELSGWIPGHYGVALSCMFVSSLFSIFWNVSGRRALISVVTRHLRCFDWLIYFFLKTKDKYSSLVSNNQNAIIHENAGGPLKLWKVIRTVGTRKKSDHCKIPVVYDPLPFTFSCLSATSWFFMGNFIPNSHTRSLTRNTSFVVGDLLFFSLIPPSKIFRQTAQWMLKMHLMTCIRHKSAMEIPNRNASVFLNVHRLRAELLTRF